jgi:hypothetical protein
MPLDYEQNGYGQPDPTAEDLGLTPVPDADAAPEWLLADRPALSAPPICCDEYAVEWTLRAGADWAYVRHAEDAQVVLLQAEVDRRQAHDLAKSAVSQAAETEVRIKDREREIEQLLNSRDKYAATIKDLREGHEVVRRTLDGFGFTRGSLPDRIKAMHEELVQLRQQVAEQPAATTPPEPVRDKEAAVLSLAYLRAYLRITDAGEVQQRAYDLLCDLGRPWHQRKRFVHVVTRVQEAGIKVGLTPQEASQPLQVIQGQGGIQRKPAS